MTSWPQSCFLYAHLLQIILQQISDVLFYLWIFRSEKIRTLYEIIITEPSHYLKTKSSSIPSNILLMFMCFQLSCKCFTVCLNLNPNKDPYVANGWCVSLVSLSLLVSIHILCMGLHSVSGCVKHKLAIISVTFPLYIVYLFSPSSCFLDFSLYLWFSVVWLWCA